MSTLPADFDCIRLCFCNGNKTTEVCESALKGKDFFASKSTLNNDNDDALNFYNDFIFGGHREREFFQFYVSAVNAEGYVYANNIYVCI